MWAAPIEISNHSFETPALGANGIFWTNDLPAANDPLSSHWKDPMGAGSWNRFVEYIGGFASEGVQHLGVASGSYIFQNLGVPFEANTTYTLTVGIGYRTPNFSGGESWSVIGFTTLDAEPGSEDDLLNATTTDQLILSDDFLAAHHVRVDSVALNHARLRTFSDVTLTLVTDGEPPVGNIVIVLGDEALGLRSHFDRVRLEAVSAIDPDGDRIPGEWELGTDRGVPRDLDPSVDDGGEDPDGDSLTNYQEFIMGTHPQLVDSDSDGLSDDVEAATDPLNADTDGDTLIDGDESLIYGTDPNDPDSDGDGFEDQAEVAAGADPLTPEAFPQLSHRFQVGVNFVGGIAESVGAKVTALAGVVPQRNWNNLEGGAGSPILLIDANGLPSIMRMNWQSNNPAVAGGEANDTGNSQLMRGLIMPRGSGSGADDYIAEVTVRNIAYATYDLYVYCNLDLRNDGALEANDQGVSLFVEPYSGSYVEVDSNGDTGNYVRYRNLSGSRLTVVARSIGITGFQIVGNGVNVNNAIDFTRVDFCGPVALLEWDGGEPPFQVQASDVLPPVWKPVSGLISEPQAVIPIPGGRDRWLLRVVEGGPVLSQ